MIAKRDIKEEQALSLSIMPEGLLAGLDDDSVRHFFTYLQGERALK